MDSNFFKKPSKQDNIERIKGQIESSKIQEARPEAEPFLPKKEVERPKMEMEKAAADKEKQETGVRKAPVALPRVKPLPLKDEQLAGIERVMEDGLADVYVKMPPGLQKKFKAKGETTAKKIQIILQQTKFKTHKIFRLIISWLKIIPGVNKFFIRQEAKIKTEKIINLKNQ